MITIESRLQDTLSNDSASPLALVTAGGEALMAAGLWGEDAALIAPAQTALERAVKLEQHKRIKWRGAAYHAAQTFLPFVAPIQRTVRHEPVTRHHLQELQQGITGALKDAVAAAGESSHSRAVATNVYQLLLGEYNLRIDTDQVHIAFPAPPSTAAHEWQYEDVLYPTCDTFVASNDRDSVAGSGLIIPTQVRSHLELPLDALADLYPGAYFVNLGATLAQGIKESYPETYYALSYAPSTREHRVDALRNSRATMLAARMLLSQAASGAEILGNDARFLADKADFLVGAFDWLNPPVAGMPGASTAQS